MEPIRPLATASGLLRIACLAIMTTAHALAWPGNPASQVESDDYDADGTTDFIRTTEYAYSAKGQITKREVSIDRNADGTADELHRYSYSYDSKGKLTGWRHAKDATADGTFEYWRGKDWWEGDDGSRHYKSWRGPQANGGNPDYAEGWDRYDYIDDKDGTRNLSRISWFDQDGDGKPDLRKAWQTHQDPVTGHIVETNKGMDTDGSAPWEYFERRYFVYSKDGNSYDYTTDVIQDGVEIPGEWGGAINKYNDKGHIIDESRWKGIQDGATSSVHNWYEYEYDAAGRIVYKTKSEDLIGPPAAERWNSWTRTYHPNGRLKEEINTGWHNKVIDLTNEIQWENRKLLDEQGRLLAKSNDLADIVRETRELHETANTYDDAGRLSRVVQTESQRLNGRPNNITTKTVSRAADGRVMEIIRSADTNADGVTDRIFRREFDD